MGSLYTVHPSRGECFYLRILLTKKRGPRCFDDLKRFEGRLCGKYQEACLLRGYLESDNHLECTLRGAAATKMASAMLQLFAVIICHCSPANPTYLSETFKGDLSEDILRRVEAQNPTLTVRLTPEMFNEALILIENICLA